MSNKFRIFSKHFGKSSFSKLILLLSIISFSACAEHHDESNNNANSETNIQMVTLKTSAGDIELALNTEKAPLSVANFLAYARSGHYDGTIFHRVIKDFMIQGGGFEPGMNQKDTLPPVINEANNGLENTKYTVAMARTNDPHSATAQFFINAKDNDFLNFSSETSRGWGYTVFAEVVNGQDVVDAIENVATGQAGSYGDVPVEDVVIEQVVISE
ncbi:MAG: peptidyl-prolyl cis-trans isomerase B (cyclophilin B) [Cryomorphaceae bacterium]|jgi:peptidyl-prolyl cis-trans isomerase B (cyclophilin B)